MVVAFSYEVEGRRGGVLLRLFRFVTFTNYFCRFLRRFLTMSQAIRQDYISYFQALRLSILRTFCHAIIMTCGRGFSRLLPTICDDLDHRINVINRMFFYLNQVLLVRFRNYAFGTFLQLYVNVFRHVLCNTRIFRRRIMTQAGRINRPIMGPRDEIP